MVARYGVRGPAPGMAAGAFVIVGGSVLLMTSPPERMKTFSNVIGP
jgi:hypothetical protein